MSLALLGIGTVADDGTGDTARDGGAKILAAIMLLNQIVGPYDAVCYANGSTAAGADTVQLQSAFTTAMASAHSVAGFSDPLGASYIRLANGTFYVDAPLMDGTAPAGKTRGIVFGGMGQDTSSLVYAPSVAAPLITNRRLQNMQIERMSVLCSTAGCDFMQSQEQKGLTNIQYNLIDNCAIAGFQYGFFASGHNNNSEWTIRRCAFGVFQQKIFYVPPSVTATVTASNADLAVSNSPTAIPLGCTVQFTATLGNIAANTGYYVVASTGTTIQISLTAGGSAIIPSSNGTLTCDAGSDQTLNVSFQDIKYGGNSTASLISLGKGGHVVISGYCDVSQWAPTSDTYLIELLGNSHSQGVCSFIAQKLRIEHASDHALILKSQWPQGNVHLNGVDTSSQINNRTNTAIEYVRIELTNVDGANYKFTNSNFLGVHRIVYASNSFQHQAKISYASCDLLQQANPASFALFTASGGNAGGAPVVSFDQFCRSTDDTEICWTDLNWQKSCFGVSQRKIGTFVGANADGPTGGGNIQRKFPLNALATGVYFTKDANSDTGAYDFTLQTTEGTPTVLAHVAGVSAGTASAPAFIPLNFRMTSDAMRTIQMIDTQSGTRSNPFRNYTMALEFVG